MSANGVKLDNIRKKNSLVELLPGIGRNTGTAIYPNVYLPKTIYTDVHSDKPNPYNICLVLHEQEHIKRIKREGIFKWYTKYLFSRKFRFEEELAATKPQLAFIKSKGLTFDLQRKARLLSGWLYLWSVNYDNALKRLKEIWNNA